jgi:biopolymer transport protein ExbB
MIDVLIKGGPLMVPLLLCSVAALAVVFDRFIAFRNNDRHDSRALRARVLTLLREERIDEAIGLCEASPGAVAAVMLAGLQTYRRYHVAGTDRATLRSLVEDSMQDYSLNALSAMERRFGVLTTVSSAAPLLGMTGTVTGMISAFTAFAGSGDPAKVGAGIAEALITTAAGLLIALVAVIPYNYFSSRSSAIDLVIQQGISEVLDIITMQGLAAAKA